MIIKKNGFLIKPKYLIIDNCYVTSWKPLRQTSTETMKKRGINEDQGKRTTDKEWAGGCLNLHKPKSYLWCLANARTHGWGPLAGQIRRPGRCSEWEGGKSSRYPALLRDHGLKRSAAMLLS